MPVTEDDLAREVAALKETFGEVLKGQTSGGGVLLRIQEATLPAGCSPTSTPVLLVVQPGRPQIFVKPDITLRNGVKPRSTTPVQVEGEAWMQFSYSFTWEEENHSFVQLVGAALQRFAKLE